MRLFIPSALCLLVLAGQAAAGSKRCGDDVDGGGTVPCACGDTLVGSRVLDERDPVTHLPCPGTALVVDVPAGSPAPTLNLGGRTVEGSGRGVGIHVLGGGDGGLTLVGPGTVRAFDIGVLAGGGLARASGVIATDNASDGFRVVGAGYAIASCQATRNGRDGFALRGSGFQVEGNQARDNGRYGLAVSGSDAALGGTGGNEATGNGRDGIVVRGRDHEVVGAVASANGRRGVRARISGGRVAGTVVRDNGKAGLRAAGRDLTVAGSVAMDNGGSGVDVRGSATHDAGGNVAQGNLATQRAGARAGECRVGAPCR